jgi:hypothetical protein
VPLIARARGAELGVRAAPLPGWNTSLSVWQMALASELVFVGDEGITEPRGASRRHGVEWSNYITPMDGLILDADLAVSKARFTHPVEGGGDHVPNAIPVTASVGLGADRGGPWYGGLRLRYLGAYALEESGTHKSSPFWTANLRLGHRLGRQPDQPRRAQPVRPQGQRHRILGRRLHPQRSAAGQLQRRHRRPPGAPARAPQPAGQPAHRVLI